VTAADECYVKGSEELIRSAIENVVRNALRFTPDGASIEIALRRNTEKALLTVRDYGPGIPENMLAEVFLPFRRLDAAADNDGAGLGLAISERAISLHGGDVRAINAADGGLVIEIKLPLSA
jgi:two-component system sensor histidine kinase CpxA